MKKLFWRLLFVMILVSMMLGVALPVSSAAKQIDYAPMDVGPKIREWGISDHVNFTPDDNAPTVSSQTALGNASIIKYFIWLDDTSGYYFSRFGLFGESAGSQLWIRCNANGSPRLGWGNSSDPRPIPVVTSEQISYLLAEFDNNIIPKETSFFGSPDLHDGSEAVADDIFGFPSDYYTDVSGKRIILVSNIGDENYYDSTYPVYIAGFYSTTLEYYFDRNIISIDAYDWANRLGPDGTRPYLYEGVVAHEWQHLLHDDYDSDEENFINEGMAEFAEILCGYTPALQGHIDAAAARPENSLTVWGDQGDLEILTDYGQAGLFQIYLWEQYTQDFIKDLFHNPLNGISGVDDTLLTSGEEESFASVYHDFSTAMYIKGSFEAFPNFQVNIGHPGKPNLEAFATPGVPPWGSDYYLLWGYERIANLKFNGYQFNPLSWISDGGVLWGGTGNLIDNWAIFNTTGGGTLTFDTNYDIEEKWDFGFVQVSTDGGYTWTSLSNTYTTFEYDPSAHPNIIANLPGLTGSSGGWVNMSFDLSAYAGQQILVAFCYMTDWATTEAGWFIDDVYVGDTLISDGSSSAVFKSLNEVLGISNEYTVTLIGEKINKGKVQYSEPQVILTGGYVAPWISIRQMFDNYTQLVMVVTYDAVEGVNSYADYTFEIDHRGGSHIK